VSADLDAIRAHDEAHQATIDALLAEVDSLRRQVAEMVECGLSIHKRVAAERAAIVAYLQLNWSNDCAADIEEGKHHAE
jgi:hypothetical protein